MRRGVSYVAVAVDQPLHTDFDRETLLIGNYIPICCVLHRRDCLDVVGGFDETRETHEEWELWLRFAERWPLLRVPRVTCSYSLVLPGLVDVHRHVWQTALRTTVTDWSLFDST